MKKSIRLSRREVLKGAAGVTLALPLLEAMAVNEQEPLPR